MFRSEINKTHRHQVEHEDADRQEHETRQVEDHDDLLDQQEDL